MTELNGTAGPGFERVREAAQEQLDRGTEVGFSLAVDLDGERVVDLWGGHRDVARTQAWQRDTITNVWSITKTVTSLAALVLIDAGELDAHAPVARYWPGFAANGKERIEVRHLLSHTSGLSGLEHPARLSDLYDTRATAERLAGQEPWWEPGTASGYHVLTYGHLVGELVHRITGRSLKEFVAEQVAPDVDFQIGLRAADTARVADVVPPNLDFDPEVLDHDTVAYKTFTGPAFDAGAANSDAWRAADLGAANGHGNARSVVAILAGVVNNDVLKQQTIDLIFEAQSDGPDLVNGLYLRWGIGYALPDRRTLPYVPDGRVAFWGGWGGSMAIMDFDRHLTISYVMNGMDADILGSPRADAYIRAVYNALPRGRMMRT